MKKILEDTNRDLGRQTGFDAIVQILASLIALMHFNFLSSTPTASSLHSQSIAEPWAGPEYKIPTRSSSANPSRHQWTFDLPTKTPLPCPTSNATVYTAATGSQFLIECNMDHQGGDFKSVQVTGQTAFRSYNEHCVKTPGCLDVSLSGVACYMKSVLGKAVSANSVLGAQLLPNTTSG